MQGKLLIKILFATAVIGFTLNIIWENLQAPLYGGFVNFSQHFWPCLSASINDMFIILFFYFLVAIFRKNILWIKKIKISDMVLSSSFGAIAAFAIEYFAIAWGKWSYLPSMPLLPFTFVGLTPFIQLLILTPLTFFLIHLSIKKYC